MSTGPPPPTPGAGQPGGSYAGQPPPAGSAAAGGPAPAPPQNPPPSAQNLNQIVSMIVAISCSISILGCILPVYRGQGRAEGFVWFFSESPSSEWCFHAKRASLKISSEPKTFPSQMPQKHTDVIKVENLSTLELLAAQNPRIPTSTFHPFSPLPSPSISLNHRVSSYLTLLSRSKRHQNGSSRKFITLHHEPLSFPSRGYAPSPSRDVARSSAYSL